ncbi:SDR family oxidoreductase [Cystobacter fuscus]|uniref:SDR family oxidoreductase n=1 Tax=Cystobacter fuscus TaxID=43 RepID=UPI002B3083FC|nr:SDR family oxidoreductase [Cystobacter fuscus]
MKPLHDKTCFITGATFGIGRETALGLARQGARVIIAGRDATRASETTEWLVRESGNDRVDFLLADLSSMAQVHRLAQAFRQKNERMDVLINNAGSWFTERKLTSDGFERTWALNHLAYVALTLDLLPLLTSSASARIINVASNMHERGTIDFDDLQGRNRFGGMRAYSQAKLANVLFTYALARRLEGTGVTVNCLHPGAVASGMGRDMKGFMRFFQTTLIRPLQTSPEQGAATSIHLASSADVEGVSGQYFEKCKAVPSSRASHDMTLQEQLWKVSLTHLGQMDPFQSGPQRSKRHSG